MNHELKIDPLPFELILSGVKKFEIRKNDRGFHAGDVLRLRKTRFSAAQMAEGAPLVYSGDEISVRVIHLQDGLGLMEGYVAMSILPERS